MKQWLLNSLHYTASSWACSFVGCARLTRDITSAMSAVPVVSNMNFSFANVLFPSVEEIQLALSISFKGQSFARFVAGVSGLLHACTCTHSGCCFLTFSNKSRVVVTFFSLLLVVFVGQRSSCSDLVFSNKCALWCSALLRDNIAQAGEFSMATNKTQVLLCQATSDYLNKCQPRNQTLEHSSSDPQDKGPIDFPH